MKPKAWLMRAAAVVLALLSLAALEMVIELLVRQDVVPAVPDAALGPFSRVVDETGRASWTTHEAWSSSFPRQSFPVDREPGSVLVFCVGGSSVYGYPVGAEIAFPRRLEMMLQSANPGREIHVVNVGGMSYGSGRLIGVVRSLTKFHPDMLVLYTGHNEFIEADRPQTDTRSGWFARLALVRAGRTLLKSSRSSTGGGASVFGLDVRRLEVGRVTGTEIEQRSSALVANLGDMVGVAREAGVPAVVCTVASNLADWRPENALMNPSLSELGVLRQAGTWVEARRLELTDDTAAAAATLRRCRIDDANNAALAFELASMVRRSGGEHEALELFELARDNDASPIRAPSAFAAAVRQAAQQNDWNLVDLDDSVRSWSSEGIPGAETFMDYCHFTLEGHHRVAGELAGPIAVRLGLAQPVHGDGDDELETPTDAQRGFSLWWLGNVEIRQGRPHNALGLLREAAVLKPESARPLVSLAQAYRGVGEGDEALKVLARAVVVEPHSAMTHLERGSALAEAGRLDEAEEELRRSMEIDSNSPWLHLNLGMLELRRRDGERALEHLLEAEDRHPMLPGVHRNIGLAWQLLDRPLEARRAFVEALRRNSFDEPSARRLAETSAQTREPELAAAASMLAAAIRGED